MRLGLLLLFSSRADAGGHLLPAHGRSLQRELQQRLLATNHQLRHVFIEPYLHELERQFSPHLRPGEGGGHQRSPAAQHRDLSQEWRLYKGVMADLVYIYVGTAERQMLIYPAWQADAGFDPRTRPGISWPASIWEMVWTEPYYDYTNGNLVIALARAITDKEGRVRGVFAVDAILAPFSAQLNRQWNSGYQMIVNQSGKVLAHPDPSRLLKTHDAPELALPFQRADGIFLDPESRQFVAYSRLPERNCALISVLPASQHPGRGGERLSQRARDHRPASVLYVVLALIWSRYFRRMVDEISTGSAPAGRNRKGCPMGMRELRHVSMPSWPR